MRAATVAVLVLCLAGAVSLAADKADLAVTNRIKDEAFNRSRVMDYVSYLTDENGPRLAASPGYQRAARWAVEAFKAAGIESARLESAGEFGRSWSWSAVSVRMVEPQATTLNAVPLAWSAGTDGTVTAGVVLAPLWEDGEDSDQGDLVLLAERIDAYEHAYAGKLGGKFVLLSGKRLFEPPVEQEPRRLGSEELEEMRTAREPMLRDLRERPLLRFPQETERRLLMSELIPEEIQEEYGALKTEILDRLVAFLKSEKVAGVLTTDDRGAGGVIFAENFGSRRSSAPVPPPALALMPEHYNRLFRLTERGVAVRLAVDVEATFPELHAEAANVIAELPGGRKRDEVVMLGAHLDSWHTGTGATDNASGCAVVMEALRILRALDLDLDRTVRVGLWDGEEQGHLGSRAYVRKHLGDPDTMKLGPEHERFSVYFNIDTGSGKTRGVLTQANDMVKPIFEAWMKPFRENGVTAIVPRNDWGTDHQAFDAVGLPAFDMLQDPLDYWSHTHHSNVDTLDHVVPQDLMVSAAFLASLAYHAANRDELMPREPLPPPLPEPGPLPEILRGDREHGQSAHPPKP
jgi:hypothetical protein